MPSKRLRDTVLIDWGTTNARAYRLGPSGEVTERRRLPRGIRQVPPGGFPGALAELLGPWVANPGECRILMSGMVGSRQGWVEAPYRSCPVRLEDLAGALCPVPGLGNAHIVPGICRSTDGARHDVMRGEEVQVFGAMSGPVPAVLCLPGTHSKWVRYQHDAIVDFATAMTGESFEVLRRHSLLGALMPAESGSAGDTAPSAPPSPAAADGLRRGLDRAGEPGGLLNHLFGLRAEGLFGAIPADGLEAYLSGLLIGHEIRGMAALFPASGPIRLVAEGRLATLYAAAFRHLGREIETVDSEAATLRGLTRVLEHAAAIP